MIVGKTHFSVLMILVIEQHLLPPLSGVSIFYYFSEILIGYWMVPDVAHEKSIF